MKVLVVVEFVCVRIDPYRPGLVDMTFAGGLGERPNPSFEAPAHASTENVLVYRELVGDSSEARRRLRMRLRSRRLEGKPDVFRMPASAAIRAVRSEVGAESGAGKLERVEVLPRLRAC